MSLSRFLQSKEILMSLSGKKPDEVKELFLQRGKEWYAVHSEERELIIRNLQQLGLLHDNQLVERIQANICLHYYEKVLPLCGGAAFYRQFLDDHVDFTSAGHILNEAKKAGKAILMATAHFGAVELIVPCCSRLGFPANVLLRFTTTRFSEMARAHAAILAASGLFGPINFIEIGKPGTMAALDMAAALRRRELLVTVFDEKTDYSVPVTLFGRKMWGGAGLNKLIKHAQADIALFTAFMIRCDGGRYRMALSPVALDQIDPVQGLYDGLQAILADHLEQWYFLHEEVPFVEE